MPVSPDDARQLGKGLLEVYADAELRLLDLIGQAVTRGIDAPTWREQQLIAVQKLRAQTSHLVADLEKQGTAAAQDAVLAGYNRGAGVAGVDLARLGSSAPQMFGGVDTAAVQALTAAAGSQIRDTGLVIKSQQEAIYRDVVQQTAGRMLTVGMTRRDASWDAMQHWADRGVTGFVDKGGRAWSMTSYAEMIGRTAASQAIMQGHRDRLVDSGHDLVMISDAPEECELCRPWEGKVLSLTGRTKAGTYDDDGVTPTPQATEQQAPDVIEDAPRQLSGSFAPRAPEPVAPRQLSGSFAPRPAPVVKTQLSGSFAPKAPERRQLAGSFAPKPVAPKPVSLDRIRVAAQPPAPKPAPVITPTVSTPVPKPAAPAPAAAARSAPREFKSNYEAQQWAGSHWPGGNDYTVAQFEAVRKYTSNTTGSGGYIKTNAALRRSGGERGAPKVFERAMERAGTVPEPITVYRGTTPAQFGLPKGADLSALTGQEFTEHGYWSTSVGSGKAGAAIDQVVQMRIAVPAGQKAMYVSGKPGDYPDDILSTFGSRESELIIDKGARYRVTNVTKKRKSGDYVVDVEII